MLFLLDFLPPSIRRPLRRAWWRLRQRWSGIRFDERFYLESNADVAASVASRDSFATAFHHYVIAGAAEGRLPVPPASAPRTERTTPAPVGATQPTSPPAPALHTEPDSIARADLNESLSIGLFYFELTTRCNLRCVYCPVSQPTYWNVDFSPGKIDEIIEELARLDVDVVQLNGHGESTIVKGWDRLANRLADRGMRLRLVTNFAKRVTPSEIEALSRFQQIMFSIDTVDADLCARLRRGANLEMILLNVATVRDHARDRQRPLELVVSVVVSDKTVHGLAALIERLLGLGVAGFRFGDLSEYPPIEGAMATRHISHLPAEELVAAGERLRLGLESIGQAGGWFEIDPPLVSLLLDQDHPAVAEDVRDAKAGEKRVHFDPVPEGMTRDCLDPWSTAYLHATGAVRPCCFFETHIAAIVDDSLGAALNGPGFRNLRRSLLEGDLPQSCVSCNARGLVSRKGLREKVEHYLAGTRARLEAS